MKKPAITVRPVTMPAAELCVVCSRDSGEIPPADRRSAARVDYHLAAEGTHLRLGPLGEPGCCYVCGPCRAALRGRA